MVEVSPHAAASIDPRQFRDVMGHYPTGVVMVAGMVDGAPCGMVVGTFTSVSIDPPLVAFLPQVTSETYQTLRQAPELCISILSHDQMHATRTLASRDPEKFTKIDWTPSAYGAPQIDGAVAHIHGRLDSEVPAGDHWISLVSVHELTVARPTTPLLFFQGGYGGFSTRGMTAHVDHSLVSAARLAEAARSQLDELAAQYRCTAAALVQIGPHDQMIGATSYGGDDDVDERIGVRLPLVPPLGDIAVAWNPPRLEAWLSEVLPRTDDARARHAARIDRTRARGYSLLRIDTQREAYRRLGDIVEEYSLGELTPAAERDLRAKITDIEGLFDGDVDGADEDVVIAALSVPVFAPECSDPANSGLILRLSNLPEHVSGAEVLTWVERLQEAARSVSETLMTANARDYERYKAAGLRDATPIA